MPETRTSFKTNESPNLPGIVKAGCRFQQLEVGDTRHLFFFFFYIEDWSEESGRTDGVCCQLWDKWSFSLESITQMIHPHPAAKLPVLAAFCLLPWYLERHLIRLRKIDMKHMFCEKFFFSLSLRSNLKPFLGL